MIQLNPPEKVLSRRNTKIKVKNCMVIRDFVHA
jgi:hypothetical protein